MYIDKILKKVEKPSRYTGGEWNIAKKEITQKTIRFAFAFPDVYEVGMSHLGLRILYEIINNMDNVFCERVFAPWLDMEKEMIAENIDLFSLETRTSIREFDILGFTLQYELSYTNVLNMLKLSGIPLLAKDRQEFEYPLVIGGGPCVSNPEPITDFFDLFLIGDGEEQMVEIIRLYEKCKNENKTKLEFLKLACTIQGVYVPSFYKVKYDGTKITSITNEDFAPKVVRKALVKDLNAAHFPEKYLVPNMGIVHDRITLEVMRGCTRGCRFCQAGYLYRPIRERSLEKLEAMSKDLVGCTGYNEISLSSLSTTDYSQISSLTKDLIEQLKEKQVSVALPSLRLDSFTKEAIKDIPSIRKTGLTFAPEAGSQRLRDVINKNVTEQDLLDTVKVAFELGWHTLKLYFMIGLPTETMEDVEGIADLANKVAGVYESVNGKKRGLTLTISTSTFVPKAHTPFMWYGQDGMESIYEKQDYLKKALNQRWFKYAWHNPRTSMMEATFARGGREMNAVLYEAFLNGCKFDGWGSEFFYQGWLDAFSSLGLDPAIIAGRTFEDDEILPWDLISYGVTKKFFQKEKQAGISASSTKDCRQACAYCGLMEVCNK